MDKTTSPINQASRVRIPSTLRRFLFSDDLGVTAIEYALVASLIALICLGGISATGISVSDLYTRWVAKVLTVIVV